MAAKKRPGAFYRGGQASRGSVSKQLHILLDEQDHAKLTQLSEKMRVTGSEVVRRLIRAAKLKGAA